MKTGLPPELSPKMYLYRNMWICWFGFIRQTG